MSECRDLPDELWAIILDYLGSSIIESHVNDPYSFTSPDYNTGLKLSHVSKQLARVASAVPSLWQYLSIGTPRLENPTELGKYLLFIYNYFRGDEFVVRGLKLHMKEDVNLEMLFTLFRRTYKLDKVHLVIYSGFDEAISCPSTTTLIIDGTQVSCSIVDRPALQLERLYIKATNEPLSMSRLEHLVWDMPLSQDLESAHCYIQQYALSLKSLRVTGLLPSTFPKNLLYHNDTKVAFPNLQSLELSGVAQSILSIIDLENSNSLHSVKLSDVCLEHLIHIPGFESTTRGMATALRLPSSLRILDIRNTYELFFSLESISLGNLESLIIKNSSRLAGKIASLASSNQRFNLRLLELTEEINIRSEVKDLDPLGMRKLLQSVLGSTDLQDLHLRLSGDVVYHISRNTIAKMEKQAKKVEWI